MISLPSSLSSIENKQHTSTRNFSSHNSELTILSYLSLAERESRSLDIKAALQRRDLSNDFRWSLSAIVLFYLHLWKVASSYSTSLGVVPSLFSPPCRGAPKEKRGYIDEDEDDDDDKTLEYEYCEAVKEATKLLLPPHWLALKYSKVFYLIRFIFDSETAYVCHSTTAATATATKTTTNPTILMIPNFLFYDTI